MLTKIQARKINKDGFIVDVIAVIKGDEEDDEITKEFPDEVLFKPRWNGTQWIEGATQEEIDEITKVEPSPPTDTELLKAELSKTNEEVLMLMELLLLGGM